ncbi:MAG TPA: porin family protein [Puia sp.]|nr:porin family protein [Puia sp.]
MKKSFILTFVLVTTLTAGSYAQGFHIGVKGGANITKIDGESFDQGFKLGYTLGGFAELNFSKTWGIQPELLWTQSKTTTTNDFNQIYDGFYNQDVTLNYLTIPVLLSFHPTPLLSLQAGPQFGILLSQPNNLGESIGKAFKSGDFSVVGGAQLNLGAFRVGARYFIGLNDINDLSNEDTWKNQGFQLYIGLRLL